MPVGGLSNEISTAGFSVFRAIKAKTADYTVVRADQGVLFHNTGAAGAVTFTLPTPVAGARYIFAVTADQTVTIQGSNNLIAFNDVAASTIAFSTSGEKVGAVVEVIGISGTKYLTRISLGSEAQTVTIT